MKALLCLVFSVVATDVPPVAVRVYPPVLLRGGAFWLTCRTRRDPRNRKLIYGVTNLRPDSERDMAGEAAPVTWPPVLVEHVGCDDGPAYCAVERVDGTRTTAVAHFVVGDCDGSWE
jgi:hypothetical protein